MHRFLTGCAFAAALTLNSLAPLARADDKKEADAPASGKVTYAEIEIKGHYPEGAQLPGLFGEMTESLDAGIARLDKAANDEKIDGVILKINSPTIGWAKMGALRKAIARIQARGKKVYAWLDSA